MAWWSFLKKSFARWLGRSSQPEPRWDLRADVERKFPRDKWDWYPVTGPEHGRQVMLGIVVRTSKMVMAEARWFGPADGVILVRKEKTP